jgi:hypothetical protein
MARRELRLCLIVFADFGTHVGRTDCKMLAIQQ